MNGPSIKTYCESQLIGGELELIWTEIQTSQFNQTVIWASIGSTYMTGLTEGLLV